MLAQEITSRFPQVAVKVADCQASLPYPDNHFDRVLAIHVLEQRRFLHSLGATFQCLLVSRLDVGHFQSDILDPVPVQH